MLLTLDLADGHGIDRQSAARGFFILFLHVFAGDGYSAGYYSYMWSEVLDADAFNAFEESGDVFDAETAGKLHQHIYAAGDSVDPEQTYLAFRGRMPDATAMLKKKGLAG